MASIYPRDPLTAEVDWFSDDAVLDVSDLDLVDVIGLDDKRSTRDQHTSQSNLHTVVTWRHKQDR